MAQVTDHKADDPGIGVPVWPRGDLRKRGLSGKLKAWLHSGDTPSAKAVKQRAKQVGSGISDIIAPSAYREVILSQELVEAAPEMYELAAQNRARHAACDHSQDVSADRAREIAAEEDRELLELQF